MIDGIAAGAVIMGSAAASAILILLLRDILRRYALARPNARSSHREPTPQGGGIAVIAATIGVAGVFLLLSGTDASGIWPVFAATAFLAVVGAWDDIKIISVAPRLLLQGLAVAIALAAVPSELRLFPALPWGAERALLLVGGIWFVNLVNFMDGIDWMMVAEVVPAAAGLALLGWLGALPDYAVVIALALAGAMIGFAPFNRPVAKLFLGDVGSLPIGLLLGWLLLLLGAGGHIAAALLLPLYFLTDATVTLVLRLREGKTPWHAHRDHFYQRAVDSGFTVSGAVACVFSANIVLIALAAVTILVPSASVSAAALAIGVLLVSALLVLFARRKTKG